jgi:hypothetical protein
VLTAIAEPSLALGFSPQSCPWRAPGGEENEDVDGEGEGGRIRLRSA